MNKVSIILPIYNGEKYLDKLIGEIRKQEINYDVEIIGAVSKSNDKSLEKALSLCDVAFLVENFNHAKTRHEAALRGTGNVLVFITQDIIPYNEFWLSNLVMPLLEKNEIVATYSRQVAYTTASETERLIREFNYPDYDRICNKDTKEEWGRKTIFYSDSSSATLREIFIELGGYDFEVGTNEDVIYALNVIESGKSILYNSKSIVYHSHDFEIRSAFNRYKLIGSFEKRYQGRLKEYSSLNEGRKLLKYLVSKLLKQFKIKDLTLLFIDLTTRFVAYKKGYNK
ncbi:MULTISPECIES: glycosyltransferase [Peribacillus]|uniref:glycosyltransferase n=1 Tax=Peribacillus TaxID=2675229 RepID=UPI001F4ECE41|nr:MULTISPECIES: glycosyltransferase [unclassified Peribacillus]MCK1981948.1 glycosyltransferase [Peribacillus sp. Aquil_B1]MCK2010008.1 glycosyltransferase [Peribacillus sp. Aquil_B8]